jgi:hypothetical protein
LYLLRRWCRSNAEDVTRLWAAGRAYAPADEVVAGVSDDLDPAAVGRLADAILTGAYEGDFAVALERAAAFFRVISEGRRQLAEYSEDRDAQLSLADRNAAVASALAVAAGRWRRDPLS